MDVIRIPPHHYIHVLDQNTNITSLVAGPASFMLMENQKVVLQPSKMLCIPPRFYCTIENPVIIDKNGKASTDQHGQYKLRHGEMEVRTSETHAKPFPLFPGELMASAPQPLKVIPVDHALRIIALRDFDSRVAGDEWLLRGPATYHPRVEEEVVALVTPIVVKHHQGIRLRATRKFRDGSGKERLAGEEWLVREEGPYIPDVFEEVVGMVNARILDDRTALHLRATRTFKDAYGVERRAGQEWLVTKDMSEAHIPDVYEEVVRQVAIKVLSDRQFAVIVNPVDEAGRPQLGVRRLRKGPATFFLQPGEELEEDIQDTYILSEEEALLLSAREDFTDAEANATRKPGERWMIYGPCDYIPPVEVSVLEKRHTIPLDENEGIYVRDIQSGKVRAVIGSTYMLKPNEELWEKELPDSVEQLLMRQAAGDTYVPTTASTNSGDMAKYFESKKPRDKTRVISFRVPHNTCVQVYDYGTKTSRICFGPNLVLLQPEEQLTVMSLSGGRPKKPNSIQTLALHLGPDFMTDDVTVVTSDHAALQLTLAYNWHFDVSGPKEQDWSKLFSVKDFIGDVCKTMASGIRGAVAGVTFDEFHKESAKIIRTAVFGMDTKGQVSGNKEFPTNGLVISSIDIKGAEPIDSKTKAMLQKSVQLAIEITTKSQEATARHEAERLEQEARGRLDRLKIDDEKEAEAARTHLLQMKAESAAVKTSGQATAEARARAEAAQIQGESELTLARLKTKASAILAQAELDNIKKRQHSEIEYKKNLDTLAISRQKLLADIEGGKFKRTVDAIGDTTLVAMARAAPEFNARLLTSLNMQGFVVMDSQRPLNLFNTAAGLLSSEAHQADDQSEQ